MLEVELLLPFPPSVNTYYKKTRNGVFIGKNGRLFRELAKAEIVKQLGDVCAIGDNLNVEVILFPPDKRKRDLDNYMKGLLDAITHSGVWLDDSQIDQLSVYRGRKTVPGQTVVRINLAGPLMPFEY